MILALLAKNVVRKIQFTSLLWTGCSVSDASTPRFRIRPPVAKDAELLAHEGATVCSRMRSRMLRWYSVRVSSARPFANVASNPPSNSSCRSG